MSLRHRFRLPLTGWKLAVLLTVTLLIGGLPGFVMALPKHALDDGARADAIVVLTGGSGRLKEGFSLLRAGRAPRMMISGVFQGVEVDELMNLYSVAPELKPSVSLGSEAEDTIGNAVETAAWVERNGLGSVILVTSTYHWPRARLELMMRLPPGVAVHPHAVVPSAVNLERWWADPAALRVLTVEYVKYSLVLIRYGCSQLSNALG